MKPKLIVLFYPDWDETKVPQLFIYTDGMTFKEYRKVCEMYQSMGYQKVDYVHQPHGAR